MNTTKGIDKRNTSRKGRNWISVCNEHDPILKAKRPSANSSDLINPFSKLAGYKKQYIKKQSPFYTPVTNLPRKKWKPLNTQQPKTTTTKPLWPPNPKTQTNEKQKLPRNKPNQRNERSLQRTLKNTVKTRRLKGLPCSRICRFDTTHPSHCASKF